MLQELLQRSAKQRRFDYIITESKKIQRIEHVFLK